ncbi:MAG: response regulator [Deltaproteobacteria bacterium]|nr:response regulator [Deltaproteobacteria bacterium]MBW2192768.1 response regulator [Deltaproteobacteria bacterium]
MAKTVLFVDDDVILRRLIQKKCEKYKDTFVIHMAGNGLEAIEALKENAISLVITDLQMPKMDGFALLAHLSEQYPDIPVIIQTGHSTPKSKKAVLKGGAAGYVEKPFKLESLVHKIIDTLKKESEGGILQSVSLEMFAQLIEMEMKTCTLRLLAKKSGKQGVLFFKEGDLLDARVQDRHGNSAAYDIFSWDEIILSIQDECAISEKKIDGELQAILFEAMRLKDESDKTEEVLKEEFEEIKAPVLQERDIVDKDSDTMVPPVMPLDESAFEEDTKKTEELPAEFPVKLEEASDSNEVLKAPEALSMEDDVLRKLGDVIGGKKCLEYIYRDSTWDELILHVLEIGKCFEAGLLKACYIDKGDATDFVLLPGKDTTVIAVNPECPRERFLQVLSHSKGKLSE